MKNEPFVIERRYPVPVERVWQALTDREQMKQWYFDIAAFEPTVGFQFTFTGENEGRTFLHHCEITDVVLNKKLRYSWRYEGFEGISYVTFELFPEGNDGSRLKLTHEGLETFPPLDDFKKENFAEGWTHIIGTSLPEYLEKYTVKDGVKR